MLTYVAMENTGVVEGDVGLSRLTHGINWEKTRRFGEGGKLEYSVPQTVALALPLGSQFVGYGRS